jgi:glycosyltransferase involved in cell wall biosynthesis
MIKIAFNMIGSEEWLGGRNYIRNLLCAIFMLEDRKIEPLLFTREDGADNIFNNPQLKNQLIRSKVFNKSVINKIIDKGLKYVVGPNYRRDVLLKSYGASVLSHFNDTSKSKYFKTVNWIPDFQHLHFPELFSDKALVARNKHYRWMIEACDLVVVSSQGVFDDIRAIAPEYLAKVRILPFVSIVDSKVYSFNESQGLLEKYSIKKKYFFLPNQLWQHKNHITVLKAVKILKDRGVNVLVVCTGLMKDFRKHRHANTILNYVKENNLGENIIFLGVIDSFDLLCLLRYSVSLINPSLFEGWSTTIEEAKSLGKNVILSKINAHREQSPPGGIYFDPNKAEELADIMLNNWQKSNGGPDYELEKLASDQLNKRIQVFANSYQEMILSIMGE